MAAQRGGDVFAHAHVMVEDEGVAAAGGQDVLVPRQRRNAGSVAVEVADGLAALGVPDLGEGVGGADCDVLAVGSPGQGGDVVVALHRHQLLDVAGGGVPEVDGLVERHSDLREGGGAGARF